MVWWQSSRAPSCALALGLIAAAGGCGRYGFDELAGDGDARVEDDAGVPGAPDGVAEPCELGPFTEPVRIFASDSQDYGPSLSADGLTLYLSNTLEGGEGGTDLWRATRPDRASAFGPPTNLGAANSSSYDGEPALSADGLTLYFESNRGGEARIWRATRDDPDAIFGPPTRLEATGPGRIENAKGPSVTRDGLELYFSSDEGGVTGLWRATRTSVDLPFEPPTEIVELRSDDIWGYPGISPDGLELYFAQRADVLQIAVARRPDRSSPFSDPEPVDTLNGGERDADPQLTSDGRTLVFTSNRMGNTFAIWQATRACL